jgi:SAM-dependent methyltransferase
MKNSIKKLIPRSILRILQNLILFIRLIFYRYPSFYCHVCSTNTKGYLVGYYPRLSLACINCFSEGKQRLISNYLNKYNFNDKNILHFAPENFLIKYIKDKKIYNEYVLADINPTKEIKKINIENINYEENYFDLIICSHVLEHVNDELAIQNLKRVLKKDGIALLMFPIIDAWDKTYRNNNIKNDNDRELHFLQHDHLHLYGKDVEQKLTGNGFELERVTPFGEECVNFGINQGETLFVLKKIK